MIGDITREALENLGFEDIWGEWFGGEEYPQFVLNSDRGVVSFSTLTDTLCIWSGLGMPEDYGYEIPLSDLSHLKSILRAIGGNNDI